MLTRISQTSVSSRLPLPLPGASRHTVVMRGARPWDPEVVPMGTARSPGPSVGSHLLARAMPTHLRVALTLDPALYFVSLYESCCRRVGTPRAQEAAHASVDRGYRDASVTRARVPRRDGGRDRSSGGGGGADRLQLLPHQGRPRLRPHGIVRGGVDPGGSRTPCRRIDPGGLRAVHPRGEGAARGQGGKPGSEVDGPHDRRKPRPPGSGASGSRALRGFAG